MKNFLCCTVFATALVGLAASPIVAQTAMSSTAMPANMATMMCRPAGPNDKPTAMMGDKGIVCKAIDMKKLKAIRDKLMGMSNGEPVWYQMLQMLPVGNGAGS